MALAVASNPPVACDSGPVLTGRLWLQVDRSDLDLPGGQLPLLQALTATGKPVVVLLIHGRQVTFGRGNVGLDGVAALVIGWRPGEEGGPAFLNLLSGAVAPSGRLAQAWPRSVGSIGGPGAPYLYPFQGNHMGESYAAGDGPSSPLFQFGFGLSCKNASNLQLLVMSRHSVH